MSSPKKQQQQILHKHTTKNYGGFSHQLFDGQKKKKKKKNETPLTDIHFYKKNLMLVLFH